MMKNYVTPDVKIETVALCDVLTLSGPIDFMGRKEEGYVGDRTHINLI